MSNPQFDLALCLETISSLATVWPNWINICSRFCACSFLSGIEAMMDGTSLAQTPIELYHFTCRCLSITLQNMFHDQIKGWELKSFFSWHYRGYFSSSASCFRPSGECWDSCTTTGAKLSLAAGTRLATLNIDKYIIAYFGKQSCGFQNRSDGTLTK